MGAAYKKNVADVRESPSLRLIELIEERGAHADYHDPFVPELGSSRDHPSLAGRRSITLDAQQLAHYDAVLIATDHDAIDYRLVADHARCVIDTRNACARSGATLERVVPA
jgi:UDP-N-acetyl-D-glucosamine dehydrogenase